MIVVGDDAYAIFATADRGARLPARRRPRRARARRSIALRATISMVEDNQQLTYPFDLELAHGLYQSLFGPVARRAGRGHAT